MKHNSARNRLTKILPTNSCLHFRTRLLPSRSVTLRFPTVGCLSPRLKQLHYLIVLWEIKSYLSVLCLHFLWRSICDLDWIPPLSQQSQRFLRQCYSPRQCHMSPAAASRCNTLFTNSVLQTNVGLWKFWYHIIRVYRWQQFQDTYIKQCSFLGLSLCEVY